MRDTVPHTALRAEQRLTNPERQRNPERRISSSTVRHLCGGISDMTLWRWLHDPELGFPPATYIARRRYWRYADIVSWLEAQSARAAK